jgi:hemolysin III
MSNVEQQIRIYTKAELLSDAAVHIVALVLAIAAVPVMITLAAVLRGDLAAITSTSIYGVTLIAMISFSLLYNHLPRPDWTPILKRLDHSAIYFKIAGTYTPFALLSGGQGLAMLAGIWIAALVGTGLSMFLPKRSTALGIGTCLAMGWGILIGGWDLLHALSPMVVTLMLAGGILYTVGTIFLAMQHWRFHNTIWHVFVMVASLIFFVAVMMHLVQSAG